MSFISAILLIIIVIIVYYVLSLFFSVLFRITGIAKDKSMFQAISLLTNAGFTTSESEIIVTDRTRRNIAKAAMLSGYFFSVLIVSLFINLFLSLDFTMIHSQLPVISAGLVGLAAFFAFLQIPVVKKGLDNGIDGITARVFKRLAKENFISVLDSYGDDAICKIYLHKVPDILEGRTIVDADIKGTHNVNILMYERNGKVRYVSRDTIFSAKDSILAFGKIDALRDIFLIREKVQKNVDSTAKEADRNEITIIENYEYQVLAGITINKVPEILNGKSLFESKIKDYFSINVMMVSRNGLPISLTKDSIIEKDDKVVAFGPYQSIQTVFGGKS